MSGTGKSILIGALAARGYKAVDADTNEWSEWVSVDREDDPFDPPADPDSVWRDRDWVWREDRIQRLLSTEDADVLFVGGTASNQGMFHSQFDHIVLLSAPAEVLVERLDSRTTNAYGKGPGELERVLHHVQTVEPLLRRAASAEVDTSGPLDQVVEEILNIVRRQGI
jgi:dephospho-CoA kinase